MSGTTATRIDQVIQQAGVIIDTQGVGNGTVVTGSLWVFLLIETTAAVTADTVAMLPSYSSLWVPE